MAMSMEQQAVNMGMSPAVMTWVKAQGIDLAAILALLVKEGPVVLSVLNEIVKLFGAVKP
jgi:hypothetical protein